MRIGWIGYNSLRREKMAPIGAVDQYYTLLVGLRELTGEPVHWMQLKHLEPGAETPDPGVAEDDELWVHRNVIHYGDCFRPMMQWVNRLPTVDRLQESLRQEFDWSQLKYQVPHLDVVVVEATGQMGAAYGMNTLLRRLWQINPNIGFVIFDQDMASPTVKSKMRRWHPDPEPRQVTATHYTLERYPTQVVALTPHLDYRNMPPVGVGRGVVYVGNDYKRREPMMRLMRGHYFHHYGRLKPEFAAEFAAQGVVAHGPFVPSKARNIESLYRGYGFGVHCLREDAYRLNLIAVRLSEIARAGCFAFVDHQFTLGKALSGDFALVRDADEILQKATQLIYDPGWMQALVAYQQKSLGFYTSSQRWIESIYRCCQKLHEGPIRGPWKLNLYQDAMKIAGLPLWGDFQ